MASTEVAIGYWLSSEEHGPNDLVANAAAAEAAGFDAAMLSDHFHPWVPKQASSPFAWPVLGAIAHATTRLRVGTGVSAAVRRIHPLVLAHAAATVSVMMPGRFSLGLGSGERLNEQVTGERWPRAGERREMLEEAIEVIRALFAGGNVNHVGQHFRVENAELFTRPETSPPILVAAGGPRSAELAGRVGDGMLGVAPDAVVVEAFEAAGGTGKPRVGQLHVCWAEDEHVARRTALEWWPNGAIRGSALTELARPADMAAAAALADEDDIAETVICGPDPEPQVEAVQRFVAAGFTEVHIHQVGPDQRGFLGFAETELLPRLRR